MTAGISAFWGIFFLGERYGRKAYRENLKNGRRLDPQMIVNVVNGNDARSIGHTLKHVINKQEDDFKPNNQAFMVAGILIIWVCYLFFNSAKTYDIHA